MGVDKTAELQRKFLKNSFSYNTMNILKIFASYNFSLKNSIFWHQFWDSWVAHTIANLPPQCRKSSVFILHLHPFVVKV